MLRRKVRKKFNVQKFSFKDLLGIINDFWKKKKKKRKRKRDEFNIDRNRIDRFSVERFLVESATKDQK